ncbi:hypothetical protein OUZ56_009669 [Daphnia magna]|uniref:Uncharacterized protein n=1 Tax=Daphnia magna TaxID=35525 RepID=A0ABR0AGM8_9CRUS|nr:hypothetical protein OUZ56_009669 [Daphnia magna]
MLPMQSSVDEDSMIVANTRKTKIGLNLLRGCSETMLVDAAGWRCLCGLYCSSLINVYKFLY